MGTDQIVPVKDNKLLIAFLVAMCVIFCLVLWMIFHQPKPIIIDASSPTRDSIKMLTREIEEQKGITDHYLKIADSLSHLPPKIKIYYYEQKKFNSTATINQLDSVIRKRAGLKATKRQSNVLHTN